MTIKGLCSANGNGNWSFGGNKTDSAMILDGGTSPYWATSQGGGSCTSEGMGGGTSQGMGGCTNRFPSISIGTNGSAPGGRAKRSPGVSTSRGGGASPRLMSPSGTRTKVPAASYWTGRSDLNRSFSDGSGTAMENCQSQILKY